MSKDKDFNEKEERDIYLGKTESFEIEGHTFEMRGFTLKETLQFSDILVRLVSKGLGLTDEKESFQLGNFESLVMNSKGDLERLDGLLCKIVGKPQGFLMNQDPSWLTALLNKALSMTNLTMVKENFTEVVKKLGLQESFGKLVEISLPESSEKSPPTKAGL